MVEVSDEILDKLCKPYGISRSQLSFLGGGRKDSDGIVYTYNTKYGERVLKILAVPLNKKENYIAFKERFEYAKFLVLKGINITYPILNNKGKLYEFFCDKKYTYIAYTMMFVKGKSPIKFEDLTDELIYNWGKIIGKAHNASKKFRIWKNISSFQYEFGFIDEVDNFYNKCKNEIVKGELLEVLKKMSSMPINRDTYGFIHNDNHENNILVNDKKITLIDFEFASCQFFINDIVSIIQRVMFNECGGIYKPITNEKFSTNFLETFIKGYREENYLDEVFIKEIDTFINYRRLIVYVSMENYLDNNLAIKRGFLENIKNPPKILLNI
ncbi:Ser/Thr protein kinase RdoA involved in Cpx stress response, MazF antagonist [Clostridium sp. DSM 8431]|uniref:phosphotransferase enzyme family protein n=1 Tax=Clostridium sp. DSM 8431 TaxID=1761781 RepID=UPI0008EC2208|nr:phosphotransferase [Clostridium sp. DSM 8431]SFU48129.1 Ser/Thr protein kinase RdoA involved in Cpx stress response, MazF antagonist [Clostridium sp. DSM 8431]